MRYTPPKSSLTKGKTLHPGSLVDVAESWTYEERGLFFAMGFRGKSAKPSYHYRYSTAEKREQSVSEGLAENRRRHMQREAEKAQARAQRKAFTTSLEVGDVVYASWGYDQTNVEYYQVVEVLPSRKQVVVRKVGYGSHEYTGPDAGYVTPQKDSFIGEPQRRPVGVGDVVQMGRSYRNASKWNGQKQYRSTYA